MQELLAPFGLLALADASSDHGQAVQGSQEATVGGVIPPHVATASPAAGTEAIKSAVIADPECGVGLDVVAPELTEASPTVEERGVIPHHSGDRRSTPLPVDVQRGLERLEKSIRLGVEDGLRWSGG